MAFTYKLLPYDSSDPDEDKFPSVLRKEDGVVIPFDPANSDYQGYLKWVAEGNTAEAAE